MLGKGNTAGRGETGGKNEKEQREKYVAHETAVRERTPACWTFTYA